MMTKTRRYGLLDTLIGELDHALRTLFNPAKTSQPNPAESVASSKLAKNEQRHSAGLMRVDHTGEICAQALYRGQATVARDENTRAHLHQAAEEEHAHLAWCESRLTDFNAHRSFLNPFWYGASFGIGVVAGIVGDRWSYGFVIETERQVEKHLEQHLQTLPSQDTASRAILSQMLADEAKHADEAEKRGGKPLPKPIQKCMQLQSKVMTTVAYHF